MNGLVQVTTEGLPPLPDGPEMSLPQPQQFHRQAPSMSFGIPRFEMVAVRRADGTFMNVEFVTILTPGDPKAAPRHKVTDALRDRYRQHYEMWRRGIEVAPQGTPLEAWPIMTPAQVQTLKANNIFTVEQLRDMADSNNHRIPMAATLRQQARKWLEMKKEDDALAKAQQENDALRNGMAMMERHMQEMADRIARVEGEKPNPEPELLNVEARRGPGRPKSQN